MKQKTYLVLAILGIILVSGYAATETVLKGNPVVINKDVSGTPASSPLDLVLAINQFSVDKTGEITAKIGKREGYSNPVNWTDVKAEIILPEGLELLEGNLNWQGSIVWDEVKEFTIKVKAVKDGEWVVKANVKATITIDSWWADSEQLYLLVKDDKVLISDVPFATNSGDYNQTIIP
ncbi:MAG: hypothetical protein WA139_01165 [Candidatus Aenigmatarchaeota archaeon]